MERDELKGRQTKGVARVTPNGHTISVKTMAGREVIAEAAEIFMDNTVRRANAALYAEAHNVANETNMWPREMQERIKELERALDDFLLWADIKDTGSIQAISARDCARVLLNK